MKTKLFQVLFIAVFILCGCKKHKLEEKGFRVSHVSSQSQQREESGISSDSLTFATRPGSVLLTGIDLCRITPVFKVNYYRDSSTFVGANNFLVNGGEFGNRGANSWHDNYLPGFSAAYGYNMVNISHFDMNTHQQKMFFKKNVLIKTLYYPSFSNDTLNGTTVHRQFFMVSVYDEDTNKDGFVNLKDLRRLYCFDKDILHAALLIPTNFSVFKSEYDPANDVVYVSARQDSNGNGQVEDNEPVAIFWIDLKNPSNRGRQY